MTLPFHTNNPGIGGLEELTASEEEFIANLTGLSYVTGDMLYYNGADLINLGVGSNGQVLTSNGTIPGWAANGAGGMLASVYDPASITEQVLGLTAAQTVSGKNIDGDTNTISNLALGAEVSGATTDLTDTSITGVAVNDVLVHNGTNWVNDGGAIRDYFNGTFVEHFDAVVTSDGTTITMSVEKTGTGDLTAQFTSGASTLDCTPAATISLTAGTDSSPQSNYVYLLQSTGVLTKSTTGWSSAEHIKIGYFYVQSAVTVQTYGALINQNWNEGSKNGNGTGHITHIGQWIRSQGATYFSGCDGGGTSGYLTTYAGGATFQVNAGVIAQVHQHSYPSHDTSGTDVAICANYPSSAFKEVTDINEMLVDSAGVSLTNRYFNIIIGGVANKGGEYTPLMMKLPAGSYNSSQNAIDDVDSFDDYSMPREFNKESSTGFLMARITVRNQSDTTFTVMNTQDLRGQDAAISGGSIGGGTTTDFADNQFTVYNNTDATKIITLDATSITTGNTRNITMADTDVDLADIALNTAKITYPSADSTKVGFISVTQAVDLDTMESDIATNNAKISYTDAAAVALNTAKVTNATHTGEVTGATALTIVDNIIDEANLKLDTAPTNDYVLTADSTKTGGMKWAAPGGGGGGSDEVTASAYPGTGFPSGATVDRVNETAAWQFLDGSARSVFLTFTVPAGADGLSISKIEAIYNNDSTNKTIVHTVALEHFDYSEGGTVTRDTTSTETSCSTGSTINKTGICTAPADSFNAIPVLGAGDVIGMKWNRVGDAGSDNYTATLRVVEVRITFA